MTRYRIGIDLGTTNCALASVPAESSTGRSRIQPIIQPESAHSEVSLETLPSFLHLPPEPDAGWIAGRYARSRAAEIPGRVVSSAKSWLVHHATDRRAKFLPQGTRDLDPADQLSPVGALALLLKKLADAWNATHPEAPLAEQEVAVTVPASFDPAAQQLTLEATREAGFPASTLLLEEPQAAFYAWLETGDPPSTADKNPHPGRGYRRRHHRLQPVLVRAKTRLRPAAPATHRGERPPSARRRQSRSRPRAFPRGKTRARLATPANLVRPTSRALSQHQRGRPGFPHPREKTWPVAVAKPGASLLAGTLRAEVSAKEIERLLLEGFFPPVGAGERPLQAAPGLREMGLPYAKDPAVTRHLADFLRGRPPVDFLLFNGGLTKSPAICNRLVENLSRWQPDHPPKVLENTDPDLAVARGAARFLHLRASGDSSRIEAGASHAYYAATGSDSVVCILPQDAPPETQHTAAPPNLRALVGKPASFRILRNPRRPQDEPGSVARLDSEGFTELPPLETILTPPGGERVPADPAVRVSLRATLRSTGLLRVELLCAEPGLRWDTPWPLEFHLRGRAAGSAKKSVDTSDTVTRAGLQLAALLDPARKTRQKLTANTLFTLGEKSLGAKKSDWSGGIVRRLFDLWLDAAPHRHTSAEHEETWLHLAGWFLRPGCGMTGDPERVAALAEILAKAPKFPSGAVRIQRWICARRIAAGLDSTQASTLWTVAAAEWKDGAPPTAETALLAGSLETLPAEFRAAVARRIAFALDAQPNNPAWWKALGRLLSRTLFHAGAEQILPPDLVEEIWNQLRDTDPGESLRPEAAACWLRAARLTGLRAVDIPKSTRHQIDATLKHWDATEVRRRVLHETVPLAASDQTSLLGEAPPPGLTLD
jgi:hypothetical protein